MTHELDAIITQEQEIESPDIHIAEMRKERLIRAERLNGAIRTIEGHINTVKVKWNFIKNNKDELAKYSDADKSYMEILIKELDKVLVVI